MRHSPDDPARQRGLAARRIGVVIAATTVLWLLVQEIGRQYGWGPRAALAVDIAALAAFAWALVSTYRLWRARRG